MFDNPRVGIARTLSIVGHPMAMLPVSALAVSIFLGTTARILIVIGTAILVSAGLGAWARHKVVSGEWSHVDAIKPSERHEWNRVLLVCFAVIAAGFTAFDAVVAVGSLALAFVILCAIVLAPWLKLSQHVAFAVMSAWVVGTVEPYAGAAFAALALGVAWSRLALQRHTVIEVVAGAISGTVAGAALWAIAEASFR